MAAKRSAPDLGTTTWATVIFTVVCIIIRLCLFYFLFLSLFIFIPA